MTPGDLHEVYADLLIRTHWRPVLWVDAIARQLVERDAAARWDWDPGVEA